MAPSFFNFGTQEEEEPLLGGRNANVDPSCDHDHKSGDHSHTCDVCLRVYVDVETGQCRATNCSYVLPKLLTTSMIRVQNLCCSAEVGLIKLELDPDDVPGVESVNVDVVGRLCSVVHDTAYVSAPELVGLLNDANMGASLIQSYSNKVGSGGGGTSSTEKRIADSLAYDHFLQQTTSLGIASFTAATLFIVRDFVKTEWSDLAFACWTSIGCLWMLRESLPSLMRCHMDIRFLMSAAAIGTITLKAYTEGVMLVMALMLGEVIQSYAMWKVNVMLSELMFFQIPTQAYSPDQTEPIKLEDVKLGDTLCVRAGERIPIDGIVTKGSASVDESQLTGESVGVKKNVKSTLLAGTLVQNGYCEYQTTATSATSASVKIEDMMRQARSENQSEFQLFIDRLATYFTPFLFCLAVIIPIVGYYWKGGHVDDWVHFSLFMLVTSCPCALVLASPIAVASTLATATRFGAIVKGGDYLEKLSNLTDMCWDKTGTLTEGRFKVVSTQLLLSSSSSSDVEKNIARSSDRIWDLVGALEKRSSHPLAFALVNQMTGCVTEYYHTQQKKELNVKNYEEIKGIGIQGLVDKIPVAVGSMEILHKLQEYSYSQADDLLASVQETLNEWSEAKRTCIFVCINNVPTMLVGLADAVRPNAASVIRDLSVSYEINSIMLTGDSLGVAKSVASSLGLDNFEASKKPQEKHDFINTLQADKKRCVAMIGDGVNDAPALARSQVGIALGKAGAALSAEAAGVILMSDDLKAIPKLIKQAQTCQRIITQNVIFALLLKFVLVIISLTTTMQLWVAVVVDVVSLSMVLLNGMRPLIFDSSLPQKSSRSTSTKKRN